MAFCRSMSRAIWARRFVEQKVNRKENDQLLLELCVRKMYRSAKLHQSAVAFRKDNRRWTIKLDANCTAIFLPGIPCLGVFRSLFSTFYLEETCRKLLWDQKWVKSGCGYYRKAENALPVRKAWTARGSFKEQLAESVRKYGNVQITPRKVYINAHLGSTGWK